MKQSMLIYTERQSIRSPVQIAFTITPQFANFTGAHELKPLTYQIIEFQPNDFGDRKIEWDTELGFSTCTRITDHQVQVDRRYRKVPPTHYVDLLDSPRGLLWTRAARDKSEIRQRETLIAATNRTKDLCTMVLGCIRPRTTPLATKPHTFHPLGCYTVSRSETLFVTTRLEVQAYVVQMENRKNQLLVQAFRSQEIFSPPLKCEELTPHSTWKLSQNENGDFHLQRDKPVIRMHPDHGPGSPLHVATFSMANHSTPITNAGASTIPVKTKTPGRPPPDEEAFGGSGANDTGRGNAPVYHPPTSQEPSSEQITESKNITISTSTHCASEMLASPTQIVLTVTPVDQSKLFGSHTPIAWKVLEFAPKVNAMVESVWQPSVGFCTVEEKETNVFTTALRAHVPLRSCVQLKYGSGGYSWSRSQRLENNPKEEVMARNATSTPMAIVLCSVEGTADGNKKWTFEPFLHCGVIGPGGFVTVGPPVMLQAYAVSGYKQNQILSVKDKQEYILESWPEGNPQAIDLRKLKKNTTFILYTDDGGRAVLKETWSSDD